MTARSLLTPSVSTFGPVVVLGDALSEAEPVSVAPVVELVEPAVGVVGSAVGVVGSVAGVVGSVAGVVGSVVGVGVVVAPASTVTGKLPVVSDSLAFIVMTASPAARSLGAVNEIVASPWLAG